MYQDSVYKEKYDEYLQEVIDNAFNESNMQALYDSYTSLIQEYATSEISGYTFLNNSSEFLTAVNELKSHVCSRKSAVESYLD